MIGHGTKLRREGCGCSSFFMPASIPAGVKIEGPAENKHVIARPSGRGNLPVLRSDSHDLAGDRSRKMKKGISAETPQHNYHITIPFLCQLSYGEKLMILRFQPFSQKLFGKNPVL